MEMPILGDDGESDGDDDRDEDSDDDATDGDVFEDSLVDVGEGSQLIRSLHIAFDS